MVTPMGGTFNLLLPPLLLAICAGLSIGLTFAPCYSSLCVEHFFPYQARIHIGVYYALLAVITLFLTARVLFRSVRRTSASHISDRVIPFVGKRLSFGGLLYGVFVAAVTFATVGYWYPKQQAYWYGRAELAHWTGYMYRVIWTGVTGHWCDIWMGLVIIPVGRRSILGQVFHLHTSTLLFAHKALAYSLCVGALIHGLLYYSFLAAWVTTTSSNIMYYFIPDNPTLTWRQAGVKGAYSWFVLPTGAIAGIVLIPVIIITSLPILRRINYNTFYFIHIIFALAMMVLVCLHASTSFYFLLPGLLLWVGDWAWRLYYALALRIEVFVENAGNGWFRIRLPVQQGHDEAKNEKHTAMEDAGKLLATYYVNLPAVSRLQLHPFTAASVGNGQAGPVLLFQKGPERKKAKKRDREWTWKLGHLIDTVRDIEKTTMKARIEGPYYPLVPELYGADHILAVVGGTGITGALSLANWFALTHGSSPRTAKSFRLVWTIRKRATEQLREVQELQSLMRATPNMDFLIHESSSAGRLNAEDTLSGFLRPKDEQPRGKVWVYVSGPEGLLRSVETACVKHRRSLQTETRADNGNTAVDLDWYVARWEV